MSNNRICIVPTPKGVGGMVSFHARFYQELIQRGIEVVSSLKDKPYQAVLVIGGTRNILDLYQARQRGVRIVQRLDGMNWIQRIKWTGFKHFMKAELGNFILSIIRKKIASHLIYQSHFAMIWWEHVHGKTSVNHGVIYNGVNLNVYKPQGEVYLPFTQNLRLLMVEGSLGGGYEHGIQSGLLWAEELEKRRSASVELVVVGKVNEHIKNYWNEKTAIKLQWLGVLERDKIPSVMRSAHLFYATDVHPACPNTVIEAMACGLPVVAFDTGALGEMVQNGAGEVVPYGADAWRLETPYISALVQASDKILNHLDEYRLQARRRCETNFNIKKTVDDYLQVLLG